MAKLKDLALKEEIFTSGHRLCIGCGHSIAVRQVLSVLDSPVVISAATGCLEVCTTIYPYNAWKTPWIHSLFENAAATIAGAETMYKALKKKGKIPQNRNVRFAAFAGDGGTYDIGLQSLSGAMERGHNIVYFCLNNQAYMNTGAQRSSATTLGAHTTTSPAGKEIKGKQQYDKDLTKIMAGHNIPYVAQSSPARWNDLTKKAKKAFNTAGPVFINILTPCPTDWKSETSQVLRLTQTAHDTCVWPLYEATEGKYKINYKPKEKLPVTEWLKPQGRFKHLLKPENEEIVNSIQSEVDKRWEELLKLEANS